MTRTNKRLKEIFNRYFNNSASEDEKIELWDYVNDPVFTAEIDELMGAHYSRDHEEPGLDVAQRYEMLQQIFSHNAKPAPVVTKLWPRIAAAVAFVVFGATLFYYFNQDVKEYKTDQVAKSDSIMPGSNKAVLILANGKRISLTDARDGKIAAVSGITVNKAKDGSVVYHITDSHGAVVSETHTIETPKGGQYTINLSDGTSVTLNASSSITFPSDFSKRNERRVVLKGEGYFEVAKDKTKPFIVASMNQEVQVLGTHFNVNAYVDANGVKTTLLEGAVKVNDHTFLRPGQQSVVQDDRVQVTTVDTEGEVAWKNGRITFSGKDFKEIMQGIARWYDVEILYNYDPGSLNLSGGISRYEDIRDVLDVLQATREVKFKIEGRRITVTK